MHGQLHSQKSYYAATNTLVNFHANDFLLIVDLPHTKKNISLSLQLKNIHQSWVHICIKSSCPHSFHLLAYTCHKHSINNRIPPDINSNQLWVELNRFFNLRSSFISNFELIQWTKNVFFLFSSSNYICSPWIIFNHVWLIWSQTIWYQL